MKTKFFLLIFLLFCHSMLSAQRAKNASNFILTGTIPGGHIHKMTMIYPDENGKKTDHFAFVKNSKFVFRGFISSPVYASLFSNGKPETDGYSHFTELFLSSGNMTISIPKGDLDKAVISGSAMQDDMYELQKQDLRDSYDIDSTPPSFLFLIDKSGKIIGRYMVGASSYMKDGDNEGCMADLKKKLAGVLGR